MALLISDAELPGRAGNPPADLRADPRADPRIVAALAPYGLDVAAPDPPVGTGDPREAQLAVGAAIEQAFTAVFDSMGEGLPRAAGIERSTQTIIGVDGNEITLLISRPEGVSIPLPGVLHLHGRGMAVLRANNDSYCRWRDDVAAGGCVVVGVEFRNSAGALGAHPFPAGLEDCASALEWMDANRAVLGLRSVVLNGESGGGNLVLATAIKAKRDGVLPRINGVYAQAPFISGRYESVEPALPSLAENSGYVLGGQIMALMAALYDPAGEHSNDPLAWPYYATEADVVGLPPHVVATDELDPLRDEGLAYLRTLLRAGVSARGYTVCGVGHAGELMAAAAIPELYAATVRDIAAFAADCG